MHQCIKVEPQFIVHLFAQAGKVNVKGDISQDCNTVNELRQFIISEHLTNNKDKMALRLTFLIELCNTKRTAIH